jgi:hypothetical protein
VKKTTTKKTSLKLDRETVRLLKDHEISDAAGGLRRVDTGASGGDVCCA